ncbi:MULTISPECIES: peptidoglycan-binding domain-containing protein [unclassified Streptomyces]|jgi:peptidoglycan hydrolase-like protein with peptidoglycan-binding domain|uniref:peptidoglycan-binding domain-containing protein n=1 Tax=unclassified Streptomyces TaxID=2593676 RepID=UPI0033BC157C
MDKNRWKLGLGLLAAGLSALLTVTPAHAAYPGNSGAYGTTFVDGDGALTDDFGEQYGELGNSLCYGCGNSTNTDIVKLWQSILASEQLLSIDAIDGQFGPATRDATKAWQQRYGLGADGMVGDATWGKADDRLYWGSDNAVYYDSSRVGEVRLFRGDSSKYRDGGAYHLGRVRQGDAVHAFDVGTRIYFSSLTVR